MSVESLPGKKYLTVSLPYSNDGFSHVFGGETSECVCQGLLAIFEFIGGVPPLLIFDNAIGVERKVDYNRANLFVPVPRFGDVVQYNRSLLSKHDKKSAELHYKKQVPTCELFEEDRKALLILPPKPFNVYRYE